MTPAARPALAAAAVVVLLYAVTLGGTFVYDDRPVVRDDPRVRHVEQWGRLWTRGYFDGGLDNLYRPLTSTSYAVQWWLCGDRPWAFHAANVLLAAASAAAVAVVAARATGRAAPAWAAGLLFAAHPVHAEAVANVVGRAELGCTLAVLASVAVLLRRPLTPPRAASIVVLGGVAVLAKEQGLLAPALWGLAIALVWTTLSAGRERSTLRTSAVAVLWLWAAYLLVRQHFLKFDWDRSLLDRAEQPMILSSGVDRLLLPLSLLGRYVALLAWPAHLSPDYGGDVIGPHFHLADPYGWVGAVAVAAWVAAVVAVRHRRGAVLFCLLSMALCYAVVSNATTLIGTIFNERLIYLPSAFVAILAGLAVARVPTAVRAAALAVVVVAMSVQTLRSAAEWNRPRDLFRRALADQPGSIQLHLMLAAADAEAGDEAGRRAVLADACGRFPDYWRCWAEAARAAADAGDFAAADADLRYAMAHAFNPGLLAARQDVDGRRSKAVDQSRRAREHR